MDGEDRSLIYFQPSHERGIMLRGAPKIPLPSTLLRPLLHVQAVVEQGSMWVPVSDSWRNPAIASRRILDEAVRQLFVNRSA